jgi:prepilin-type N-terminal cleavage/methylation domain-containing protein
VQQLSKRAQVARVGFTLVELLVVIAIIAVLMAMLLPALNKARQAALTVACASNMRQYGIALQQYLSDFKGTMMADRIANGSDRYSWWGERHEHATQLRDGLAIYVGVGKLRCKLNETSDPRVNYILNGSMGANSLDDDIPGGEPGWRRYKFHKLKNKGNWVFLAEARVGGAVAAAHFGYSQIPTKIGPWHKVNGVWMTNVLWMDGRVEPMNPLKIQPTQVTYNNWW